MKKIINEYIEYTKKSILNYLKIIFEDYYDVEVSEEFLTTYINVRYYNIYNGKKEKRAFYLRIQDEINEKYKLIVNKYREVAKKQKITIDQREKKEKIMLATKEVFEILIVWDNVKDIENLKNNALLKESIKNAEDIRKKIYGFQENDEFKNILYNKVKDDLIKKDIFLENLENDIFELKLKKNKKKNNMYYVSLEHNINFPMVYSSRVIEKIFNEPPISEDKMKVEFSLLSTVVIRDLIKGNFKDIYIIDIPDSLLKKSKKMESILNTINTQTIQDKIYLKIYFYDFLKNKDLIYKFISLGFKFVIELDKTFTNIDVLEYLKIFKYVLATDRTRLYKEVLENSKKYDNILEK